MILYSWMTATLADQVVMVETADQEGLDHLEAEDPENLLGATTELRQLCMQNSLSPLPPYLPFLSVLTCFPEVAKSLSSSANKTNLLLIFY